MMKGIFLVEFIKIFLDIESFARVFVLVMCTGIILFTVLHLYITKGKLVYGYSFKENIKLKEGVDRERFIKDYRRDEYLVILVMVLVMTFSVHETFAYISALSMVVITSYMIIKDRKLQNQIEDDEIEEEEEL